MANVVSTGHVHRKLAILEFGYRLFLDVKLEFMLMKNLMKNRIKIFIDAALLGKE